VRLRRPAGKVRIRVLLLDKNREVGGKAVGIDVNGFKGEFWPTYGIPNNVGPFVEIFRALGIEGTMGKPSA